MKRSGSVFIAVIADPSCFVCASTRFLNLPSFEFATVPSTLGVKRGNNGVLALARVNSIPRATGKNHLDTRLAIIIYPVFQGFLPIRAARMTHP